MAEGDRFGISQFSGGNYRSWQYRVVNIFKEKGLHIHFNGCPVVKPDTWDINEQKAKNLLLRFLDDKHADMCQDYESVKDMWDALKTNYDKTSTTNQLMLTRKLATMKYTENSNLKEFFREFDKTIRDLKQGGVEFTSKEKAIRLLIMMPESFNHVTAALKHRDETKLTVELVKNRLLDEELKTQ